jgi:hypothetical protein
VAASGPSLNSDALALCRGTPTVVVNDAYRLCDWADVLYGCDESWWDARNPKFAGEKWSSHNDGERPRNNKRRCARRYSLRVVRGKEAKGFSLDPGTIHYGYNSGFQAVNLAILMGGNPIVLLGFDMHGTHFFGAHEPPLRNKQNRQRWVEIFNVAAKMLPPDIKIINATPGSLLKCFPAMDIKEALYAGRSTGS